MEYFGSRKRKYPLWQWLISIAIFVGILFYLISTISEKDNQFDSTLVDEFAPSLSREAKLEGAWLRLSGPVESVVFFSDRTFYVNEVFFGSNINYDYHISGCNLNYIRDGVDYTTKYTLEKDVLTLHFGNAVCIFRKVD